MLEELMEGPVRAQRAEPFSAFGGVVRGQNGIVEEVPRIAFERADQQRGRLLAQALENRRHASDHDLEAFEATPGRDAHGCCSRSIRSRASRFCLDFCMPWSAASVQSARARRRSWGTPRPLAYR